MEAAGLKSAMNVSSPIFTNILEFRSSAAQTAAAAETMPFATVAPSFNSPSSMRKYSDLLHGAIDSIVSVKEENDIDSLFSVGETTALRGEIKGLDDFELITFLIIR